MWIGLLFNSYEFTQCILHLLLVIVLCCPYTGFVMCLFGPYVGLIGPYIGLFGPSII